MKFAWLFEPRLKFNSTRMLSIVMGQHDTFVARLPRFRLGTEMFEILGVVGVKHRLVISRLTIVL